MSKSLERDEFEGGYLGDVDEIKPYKTQEKGKSALAFTVAGRAFAFTFPHKVGTKLMIHLMALLGKDKAGKSGKRNLGKSAKGNDLAMTAYSGELIPQDDGRDILLFDMGDLEFAISMEPENAQKLRAQYLEAASEQKTEALDVDDMTARPPNALETDRQFFLKVGSGGTALQFRFGHDHAKLLRDRLDEYLSQEPGGRLN